MLLLDHEFRERAAEFAGLLQGAEVVFAIERGEAAKTLEEAGRLLGLMAEARLARDDFLVVAGGGSLCDLGAFCAGLHRRGLNLVLIPTTLLAAVDAAVGGKTAVNHAGAKNQVGHFHLASEVWIDPYILATLPEPLKLEGLTEAYKTGLLLDPDLADLVENHLESLLAGDVTLIAEVARRSASAKAALVERDFRETLGIRDILNLGHTWGHVVESHHGPVVSHGRAVALGLAVALRWSVKNLGYPETLAERGVEACRLLAGGSFPAAPPKSEAERLLTFDKKIRGGKLKYVGLEAPGEPVVVEADPEDVLTTAASF
jgi:3-dehydroquinate synthetase